MIGEVAAQLDREASIELLPGPAGSGHRDVNSRTRICDIGMAAGRRGRCGQGRPCLHPSSPSFGSVIAKICAVSLLLVGDRARMAASQALSDPQCNNSVAQTMWQNGVLTLQLGVLTRSKTDKESLQSVEAVKLALDEIRTSHLSTSAHGVRWQMAANAMAIDWQRFKALEASLALVHNHQAIALVGMAASTTVSVVAPVAGTAGMPAIATAVTNRDTREGTYYPTFMRACPSDIYMASALKDLVLHYVWDAAAMIYSTAFSGFHAVNDLIDESLQYGVNVQKSVHVEFDGVGFDPVTGQKSNLSQQTQAGLLTIKAARIRIIVLNVHGSEMQTVLEFAKSIGMLERGYAWIVTPFFASPELMSKGLVDLLNGSLVIRPQINAAKAAQFARSLHEHVPTVCPSADPSALTLEAVYAYDATHAMGAAVRKWLDAVGTPTLQSCEQATVLASTFYLRQWNNASMLVDLLRNASPMEGVGGTLSLSNALRGTSYDIFNMVNGKLVRLGQWAVNDGLDLRVVDTLQVSVHWTGGTLEVPSTDGYINQHMRLLVPLSNPFTSLVRSPPQNNEDYGGIAIDLLKLLSVSTGFTYTLNFWNGSWTEMVRVVGNASSPYDMAVGSITVNAERSQLCTFTKSIYLSGLRILVRRPLTVRQGGYWSFFEPFHWSVWVTLVISLLFSGIVLTRLDPEGIETKRQRSVYVDGIFFSFMSFFFVHEADEIKASWARVYLGIVQFAMLVLVTAYTANMATFLSGNTNVEITEYNDLYQKPVAVRNGTANWLYVTEDLGLRYVVPVKDGEEAVSLLRSKKVVAYIGDSPHIRKIASTACDLVVLGTQVDTQQYAFAMTKNSPWLPQMDRSLNLLISKGTVSRLFDKYVPSSCPAYVPGDSVSSMTLEDLGGLFILVAAGAVLAGLVKLYVLFLRRKKINKWRSNNGQCIQLDVVKPKDRNSQPDSKRTSLLAVSQAYEVHGDSTTGGEGLRSVPRHTPKRPHASI